MIKHAVILSAGLGTRFLPFTKAIPKPMLPIVDTPAIEFVIKEALESGITHIIVVVGANGDVIKRHFSVNKNLDYSKISKELREKIAFSDQIDLNFATQHVLDGTANAVLNARSFVNGNPFLIMNADELFVKVHHDDPPVSKQLIDMFNKTQSCIIGTQIVDKTDASRLGVVEGVRVDENTRFLKKIIEKPPIELIREPIVNLGRYIVKNDIFRYLESVKPNTSGEKALTDALVDYSKNNDVLCYNFLGKRYDIGNKNSYMRAIFDFSMQNPDFYEYVSGMFSR